MFGVEFEDVRAFHGTGRVVGIPGPAFEDAPESGEVSLRSQFLAEITADCGAESVGIGVESLIRVIEGVRVHPGVCEGHVDFDEKVDGLEEDSVGDVVLISEEGEAVSVEGQIEDEPHSLHGVDCAVWEYQCLGLELHDHVVYNAFAPYDHL